jgi:hypothetical protein
MLKGSMYTGGKHARLMEEYTLHGKMHNAWNHADILEAGTHSWKQAQWKHAHCIEAGTLHRSKHTA